MKPSSTKFLVLHLINLLAEPVFERESFFFYIWEKKSTEVFSFWTTQSQFPFFFLCFRNHRRKCYTAQTYKDFKVLIKHLKFEVSSSGKIYRDKTINIFFLKNSFSFSPFILAFFIFILKMNKNKEQF